MIPCKLIVSAVCAIVIITSQAGCSKSVENESNNILNTSPETTILPVETSQASPNVLVTKPQTPLDISQTIFDFILKLKDPNPKNVMDSLNLWANESTLDEKGFWLSSVAAEKFDESLPDVLLISFSRQHYASYGYAVYWWENGNLKYQVFPIDNVSENAFSDQMTVISARMSKGDNNSIEIGFVLDNMGYGNGGWSKPLPVFKLLRLKESNWELLWSSPKAEKPIEKWENNHGTIQFTNKDLSEFVLQGDSLFYSDGKENILEQTKDGRMRYIQQTWLKTGDKYKLKSSRIAPSTYSTLVDFIDSTSKNEDKHALQYIADKELIVKAKKLNLVQKSLTNKWWVVFPGGISGREEMDKISPLIVVLNSENGNGVKVNFIDKDGDYIISALEEYKN